MSGRFARFQLDHDHPRHRQFVDRKPRPEPGLEQTGGFLLGIGPHLGDAVEGAGDIDGGLDRGIEIATGSGPDLNRHLAQDFGLPFGGIGAHQHDRTGGERSEIGHDRHDRDQRPAADRLVRHDRGFDLRQRRARRGHLRLWLSLWPFGGFARAGHDVLNRRDAAGRHAARAGARRTGPSGRCRGSRSRSRCRTC